jgi:hypothetical protein
VIAAALCLGVNMLKRRRSSSLSAPTDGRVSGIEWRKALLRLAVMGLVIGCGLLITNLEGSAKFV